jgi:hypothetical protein
MSPSSQETGEGPVLLRQTSDFSLVLGGPLFQLLRRAHLSDDAMTMARRRIIVMSLADVGKGFEVVRTMRLAPVTKEMIVQLAVATLAPIVPLALTIMPLEELLKRLLGILF